MPPARREGLIEACASASSTALARETEAVLVMSSSWREDETLDDLRAELARAGVVAHLADVTPVLFGQPRWT